MTNKKILIVDDEISLVEILKEYFQNKKYEVIIAYDGEDAVIKAKENIPDLILLDILMPKMDGVSALRVIKKDSCCIKTRVIMLTNIEEANKTAEAMEAGACGYLIKIDNSPDDLYKRIEEILN